MTKKNELISALVDLTYNGSYNQFEEFYGDHVSYKKLEQESYIDFKNMLSNFIGKVKFRKAREISLKHSLTCRIEITRKQFEEFENILTGNEIDKKLPSGKVKYKKFFFIHNFCVKNLRFESEEEIENQKKLKDKEKMKYNSYLYLDDPLEEEEILDEEDETEIEN